jgi:hypothetical protein
MFADHRSAIVVPLQVCDTVAELAAITLAGGGSGWPELLPFLSQAVQSGQPRLMEASLLIFAQLAGHMMDTLLQFLGTLLQVRLDTTGANTTWRQASGNSCGVYPDA